MVLGKKTGGRKHTSRRKNPPFVDKASSIKVSLPIVLIVLGYFFHPFSQRKHILQLNIIQMDIKHTWILWQGKSCRKFRLLTWKSLICQFVHPVGDWEKGWRESCFFQLLVSLLVNMKIWGLKGTRANNHWSWTFN